MRWDPQLRVGQPDSQYGLATYDVAQARFTGEIQLAGPWCGGADLHTLEDGRVVLWCSTAHQVRLVDPRQSSETGALSIDGAGMAVSPASHRAWVIDSSGSIHEVDLDGLIEVRSVHLNPSTSGALVPLQQPQLTSDGSRMLVLAAPGNAEARARGLGTAVWVVDTSTLQLMANVPLPSTVSHVAPTSNGHSMLVTLDSGDSLASRSMRLLEIPSGPLQDLWTARFVLADGTEVAAANPVHEVIATAPDDEMPEASLPRGLPRSEDGHVVLDGVGSTITDSAGRLTFARYLMLVRDRTDPSDEAGAYRAAVTSAGFAASEPTTTADGAAAFRSMRHQPQRWRQRLFWFSGCWTLQLMARWRSRSTARIRRVDPCHWMPMPGRASRGVSQRATWCASESRVSSPTEPRLQYLCSQVSEY